MICQKCGTQNKEDARFCINCGTPIQAGNQAVYQQNAAGNQSAYQQNAAANGMYMSVGNTHSVQSGSVAAVVKKAGSSPLFLIGTIAYSLYLLCYLIQSAQGMNGMMEVVYLIAEKAGVDYWTLSQIASMLNGSSVIGTIIGMLPVICIAIGLWMIFAAASQKNNGTMGTAGLTMIKVISIIRIVLLCISDAICVIALFVMGAKTSDYSNSVGTIFYVAAFIVAIVMGIIITYYEKIVQSVNTVKNTVRTGTASGKVSVFVGVMAFIGGGITAVSSLFSDYSIFGFLIKICSAAASIIFGIVLFQYRSSMITAMNGDTVQGTVQQPNYNNGMGGAQSFQQNGIYGGVGAGVQPPTNQGPEATILNGAGMMEQGTVLLNNPQAQLLGYLVRAKTNESAAITKNQFLIGRAADSDFCVSDNPAVGRRHAEIVWKNGNFYVIDKGSANHVYLNGTMIPSGVEVPVSEGMVIRCANEDFYITRGM